MTNTETEVKAESRMQRKGGSRLASWRKWGLKLSVKAEMDLPVWRDVKATWKAKVEITLWGRGANYGKSWRND